MVFARRLLALMISLALANYGIVATAAAHTHEHGAFHPAHVISVDDHDHGHHHDAPDSENAGFDHDNELPAPGHSETGFHTHSTPQFGPNDAGLSLAFILITDRATPPDPLELTHRHRDKPPFKPPRAIL